MGQPAARVSDMHVCPMVTGVVPHVGGPIMPAGVPTVLIGGLPAATMGDICTCAGPPDVIAKGSASVLIGGKPAARMGDLTAHGGTIVLGCFTVFIGDAGAGGAGSGGAGSAGALSKEIGAAQAKKIANSGALKKAAANGEEAVVKKQQENFTAKFRLVDEAGKAVSGKKYQITTSDGQVHDGTTNGNGETQQLTGYTTGDCKIIYKD